MGCQRLMVLSAFLLFIKNREVSAQYATVLECLPQATAALARPFVQSAGQCVLPTFLQPVYPGYDSYAQDYAAGYPGYANYPAPFPGYPPIIFDNNDNFLKNLLYFLIIAMKNKRGNAYNTPPSYGGCNCGCKGSYSSKCSCDCSSCSKNNSDNNCPTYIPVPIAIPVYTGPDGCRYIDGFCDDILIQAPSDNCICCGGSAGELLNLLIRAEC